LKERKETILLLNLIGHTLVARQKEIVSTIMKILCHMASCCPEFGTGCTSGYAIMMSILLSWSFENAKKC
jgi:hypothetical protein